MQAGGASKSAAKRKKLAAKEEEETSEEEDDSSEEAEEVKEEQAAAHKPSGSGSEGASKRKPGRSRKPVVPRPSELSTEEQVPAKKRGRPAKVCAQLRCSWAMCPSCCRCSRRLRQWRLLTGRCGSDCLSLATNHVSSCWQQSL